MTNLNYENWAEVVGETACEMGTFDEQHRYQVTDTEGADIFSSDALADVHRFLTALSYTVEANECDEIFGRRQWWIHQDVPALPLFISDSEDDE